VPRWPMQVSYHSGVGSVTCLHSCGIMNISYYTRQNGWPAISIQMSMKMNNVLGCPAIGVLQGEN